MGRKRFVSFDFNTNDAAGLPASSTNKHTGPFLNCIALLLVLGNVKSIQHFRWVDCV